MEYLVIADWRPGMTNNLGISLHGHISLQCEFRSRKAAQAYADKLTSGSPVTHSEHGVKRTYVRDVANFRNIRVVDMAELNRLSDACRDLWAAEARASRIASGLV